MTHAHPARRAATLALLLLAAGSGLAAQTAAASPYSDAVLADTPSAYWRLDETDSDCAPADAAADGAGALTAWGECDPIGGALQDADDVAQYLSHGTYFTADSTPATALSGAFTVEAWIDTEAAGEQGIVEKHDLAGGESGYGLRLDGENRLTGFLCSAAPAVMAACQVVAGPDPIAPGAWHLVDLVVTGTEIALHVDGQQVVSEPQTQPAEAGGSPLTVGADDAAAALPFEGGLDEVALYPTALTPERVAAHFAAATS